MSNILKGIKGNFAPLLVLASCCIATIFMIGKASGIQGNTHFILQAFSLLQGKFDIPHPPPWLNDLAFYHNTYYSPFGIFPALLLLPVVAIFGTGISQQILGIVALPIMFLALTDIAMLLGMKIKDALWMAIFFIFGTIFLSLVVIPISAFLVQAITVVLLLFALREYFGKKRFLLIGIFLGLGILSRDIIIFAVVFFLYEIFFAHEVKNKFRALLLLLIPLCISILLLFSFNYIRFGNVIDNGYDHNISQGQDLLYAREKGFFSLVHIPANAYLFLFKGPDPIKENPASYVLKPPFIKIDPWGLGIIFTSPLFIYLFFIKIKKTYITSALITTAIMLIPTLTYYAYGAWQYGYRHAVDFYPFLFILLISIFKDQIPGRAKVFICYGIVFNFYFMLSLWGIYPF